MPDAPPKPAPDRYRVGVMYRSAGSKVQVEAGHKCIGSTTRDLFTREQTYWFKSIAQFEANRADIFEARYGHSRPIPVFQLLDESGNVAPPVDVSGVIKGIVDGSLKLSDKDSQAITRHFAAMFASRVATGTVAAPAPMPKPVVITQEEVAIPPPPPPPGISHLAPAVFAAHNGRKIRLKEFAEELHMDPAMLRQVIESDSRFQVIPSGGWVRRVGDAPYEEAEIPVPV